MQATTSLDKRMDLVRYQCFGTTPHNGSDALLVSGPELANWSPVERHAFTVAQKVHACVFIDRDARGGGLASLDFYYPHMRSPLCLHASIAAARYVWGDRPYDDSLLLVTAMKQQALIFDRENEDVYVSVEPVPAVDPGINVQQLAAFLRCDESAVIGSPVVASIGSAKLLVEVPDSTVLRALRPDLEAIAAWGRASGVNGCYVYTRLAPNEYEGRNFNHLDERLEDTATGVAAGALSVSLGQGLTVYQGETLGNPCVIRTSLANGKVRVGGRVTQMSSQSA
jgi:predicted PhzF superfamily epimerase YddE/YHI9